MTRTVMIVDDVLFMRNLLRSILELEGYRVVAEAADGVEAVTKYRQHRPRVTIMDVIIPKKDGIAATRDILALDSEARIVLCSTLSDEVLAMAARSAGATGVISKPFTTEQVREVVGKLV